MTPYWFCLIGGTWACCNKRHPPKPALKPKSHEISFTHNWLPNYPIILKMFTGQGSDTVLLYAKFQNNLTIEMRVMNERGIKRFGFYKFQGISYSNSPLSGGLCILLRSKLQVFLCESVYLCRSIYGQTRANLMDRMRHVHPSQMSAFGVNSVCQWQEMELYLEYTP